jgi:hypothetical protein
LTPFDSPLEATAVLSVCSISNHGIEASRIGSPERSMSFDGNSEVAGGESAM